MNIILHFLASQDDTPTPEIAVSNTLNVTATAVEIIDALFEAKEINESNKVNSGEARAKANGATLRGYAVAAIAIRTMLDQGLWTSGKQKGGAVSASQAMKDALVAEAKKQDISGGKAKRLIEKAAILVVPGSKLHIPAIHVAAAQSSAEVMKALTDAGFQKEADIVNYTEPKKVDVVARIIKAASKLEGKDRTGFIKELVNHEIIDDIMAEANKITAEERDNQRKALAEAKKKAAEPKAVVVNKAAVAKAKADAKTAKEAAPAKAVPKSGGSKKGDATKAKQAAADPASDPFAA